MTKSVLIVGCGQLGSRHLQSLAKLNELARIDLLEPVATSLQKACDLFTNSGGKKELLNLHQVPKSLQNHSFDLIIIATNSDIRPNLIKELLGLGVKSQYWILEKVLSQSFQLGGEIAKALEGSKVWVNCPRRYYQCYEDILPDVVPNTPIHMSIVGSNWGLACNAIHYLSVLNVLSRSLPTIFDTSGLDRRAPPAKRVGFVEFFGTAKATFANGSTLTLTCTEGQEVTRVLRAEQGNKKWMVNEFQNLAESQFEGPVQVKSIHVPTQSELTSIIVKEIFATGDCLLPTLATSLAVHQPFLDGLVAFYSQINDKNLTTVPIT